MISCPVRPVQYLKSERFLARYTGNFERPFFPVEGNGNILAQTVTRTSNKHLGRLCDDSDVIAIE